MPRKKPAARSDKLPDATVSDIFSTVLDEWERQESAGTIAIPRADNDDGFAARLGLLHKVSRLTIPELADSIDASGSTFKEWLAGKHPPNTKYLRRMRAVWGVSPEFMLSGVGSIRAGRTRADLRSVMVPDAPSDYVLVPRFGVRAAAGSGALVATEEVQSFLAFRNDWVRRTLRRNPGDLAVIEAVGDSMEPTIANGDVLLIDRSEERIRDNAIYVLLAGDELVVKRVQRRMDGTLMILSDNKAYSSEEVPSHKAIDLKVIGRVFWAGGNV